jgi:tRNA U34 5-carboxymethylaminomethyl modifying GTPase MnmE/TrmE
MTSLCDRISSADLKLLVVDGRELLEEKARRSLVDAMAPLVDDRTVLVVNKMDLLPHHSVEQLTSSPSSLFGSQTVPAYGVSCVTQDGLTSLLDALIKRISLDYQLNPAESLKITHARHRALLQEAVDHLSQFLGSRSHFCSS